jgi:tryptophan synthase alpha chain
MSQTKANARYQKTFAQLKQKQQAAFVPFVMLADPDLAQSKKIIISLIENGADALELGIPFSDPIADGPVIQAAAIRALKNKVTVEQCFELIQSIRENYPDIAIGLLLYSNLVVTRSIDNFYVKAQQAGVDSILIADVPMMEAAPFIKSAKQHGINPIFIATPNADQKTLKAVAEKGQGYTYLLSRAGVTGTDVKAEMPLDNIINSLKAFNAPPSLLGFGISTPEQVKQAIASGADGAISGSAVVKIIENNLNDYDKMLTELVAFVQQMKAATISS